MRAVVVAAAVAFLVSLLGTPWVIKGVARLRAGQPIRSDGPQSHMSKQGTPTMGGVIFIVAVLTAYIAGHISLTVFPLPERQIAQVGPSVTALVVLGLFVFCGAIGFIDDFLKVRKRNSLGLNQRGKLLGQLVVGAVFGVIALNFPSGPTAGETVSSTTLSFIRDIEWLRVGTVGAVIVVIMVVISTTNAVNLTDGLDGLATGVSVMVIGAYGVIAFWQYRHWCHDPGYARSSLDYCYSVRDPLEIAMLACAAAAACVGFLWWNASPAKIFMGDTGSMALGGLIAAMALATRTVLLLPLIGGLFVVITMSVVIQIASFKSTGRRVFRMSPLHHHFELAGWSEVNVVIRFWIIAGIAAAMGLLIFYSDFLAATV